MKTKDIISKKEKGEKPKDEKDEGNAFGAAVMSAKKAGKKKKGGKKKKKTGGKKKKGKGKKGGKSKKPPKEKLPPWPLPKVNLDIKSDHEEKPSNI